MEKLRSLSLFVGTGKCNANCVHCAGLPLRKYVPKEDGIINKDLVNQTLVKCYQDGARALSISSSGEPTLSPVSVTKALDLVYELKDMKYSPINLYSNGIRIGEDESFCDEYLSKWKELGLTTIYVTVHDTNEERNAKFYRVESYPNLETVFSRIHNADLKIRANLVLSKENIKDCERFVSIVEDLKRLRADYISAWPIRDMEDKIDIKLSPLEMELDKMQDWIKGAGEGRVVLYREKDREVYRVGKKLTLFPNEVLSSSWCN